MLHDVIAAARASAKRAIEVLYDDECTVTVFAPAVNEDTGITEFTETVLYDAVPCRVSFGSNTTVAEDEAPAIDRDATLFIAPDIEIPAGSKISLTRQGITTNYQQSGVPAVYVTHQEIKLKLYEDYA